LGGDRRGPFDVDATDTDAIDRAHGSAQATAAP
jgi:hypothetical protein